jgi:hypothetical protein
VLLALLGGSSLPEQHQFPAAQALADKIIGQPLQLQRHSGFSKRPKRLPGNAMRFESESGADRRRILRLEKCQLPSQPRTQRAVLVGNARLQAERPIGLERSQRRFHPGVVNGLALFGTVIAPALPAHRATGFRSNGRRGQQRLQVQTRIAAYLLQQVGPSRGGRQRWQTQLGQQQPHFG